MKGYRLNKEDLCVNRMGSTSNYITRDEAREIAERRIVEDSDKVYVYKGGWPADVVKAANAAVLEVDVGVLLKGSFDENGVAGNWKPIDRYGDEGMPDFYLWITYDEAERYIESLRFVDGRLLNVKIEKKQNGGVSIS